MQNGAFPQPFVWRNDISTAQGKNDGLRYEVIIFFIPIIIRVFNHQNINYSLLGIFNLFYANTLYLFCRKSSNIFEKNLQTRCSGNKCIKKILHFDGNNCYQIVFKNHDSYIFLLFSLAPFKVVDYLGFNFCLSSWLFCFFYFLCNIDICRSFSIERPITLEKESKIEKKSWTNVQNKWRNEAVSLRSTTIAIANLKEQ